MGDDGAGRGEGLVSGTHRVIRNIDAGEGPFAGALVVSGAGVAVQADAASLSGWTGWVHAGNEHVAAPLDLVRRDSGHDVLLPWCAERATALLGRRVAAELPLAVGEISTLVVSMLRGLGELGAADHGDATGEWWVSDEGRPLLVIGAGQSAREATLDVLDRLRDACTDRMLGRVLASIAAGLETALPRPHLSSRQLEAWEAELFSVAAPRPIRRDVHPPERASDLDFVRSVRDTGESLRGATRRDVRTRAQVRSAARQSRRSPWGGAMRAGLAFAVRLLPERRGRRGERRQDADEGRTERLPSPRRGRRLAVAAVAAVSVVVIGLLWPSGDAEEPASGAPTHERAQDDDDAHSEGESAPLKGASTEAVEEPAGAVPALLQELGGCVDSGDLVCETAVAPGAVGVVDAAKSIATGGPGTSDAGEESVELVDEYGDVAVVRLLRGGKSGTGGAPSEGQHMLVLVKVAEKWLVRDI